MLFELCNQARNEGIGVIIIRIVSSYICMFALSLVEVVFRFSLRIYLYVIIAVLL